MKKRIQSGFLAGAVLVSITMPVYSQNYNYHQPQGQFAQPVHQQNYMPQPQQVQNYHIPPLHGHLVTVPPGTMIPGAAATRTLSSQSLRVGDGINVTMNAPFYYAGSMVLPPGTSIMGTVVMAEPAGRAGKNGKLMIVFNQAVTPSGQRLALSGKVATDDGTGVLKGGTGTERLQEVVKDTAVGSGVGALMGVVFGALSGGSKGKGAALGTAVGGGAGAAKAVVNKGNEVIINIGERLDIILDSELRSDGGQNITPILPSLNQNYRY